MLTGQRRAEWGLCKRSEIDTENRWLDLGKERFKSRREHIVPMSDAVWAIFERLPQWTGGNDYFVFSSRHGRVPVAGFSQGKTALDELAQNHLLKALSPEQQVSILDAYWRGIRDVLPEAFDEPSEFSVQKGIGVTVLHVLLTQVIEIVRSRGMGSPNPLASPVSCVARSKRSKARTLRAILSKASSSGARPRWVPPAPTPAVLGAACWLRKCSSASPRSAYSEVCHGKAR